MNLALLAQEATGSSAELLTQSYGKLIAAAVLGAIGIGLMVPGSSRKRRLLGTIIALVGLGALGAFLADDPITSAPGTFQILFWLLAAATIVPAAGTITAQSPVYAAILFALSLVGTAGLFLLQGAQFLGVATIVVYAGAIVVTFLFVVMLAQPEGHSTYDRIGWGKLSKPLAVVAAMGLLVVLSVAFLDYFRGNGVGSHVKLRNQIAGILDEMAKGDELSLKLRKLQRHNTGWKLSIQTNDASLTAEQMKTRVIGQLDLPADQLVVTMTSNKGDIDHPQHVANLGSRLFAQHLVAIEVAGTLLLMALVGAVAIVLQNQPTNRQGGES